MKCYFYYDGKVFNYLKENTKEYLLIIDFPVECSSIYDGLDSIKHILLNHLEIPIVIYAGAEGYYGGYYDNFLKNSTFDELNDWIVDNNLQKNKIYFISQNLLSSDISTNNEYSFIPIGITLNNENIIAGNKNELYLENVFKKNLIQKLFLTYNKRERAHRFYLMYKLNKTNLIQSGLYSYIKHEYDNLNTDRLIESFSQYFDSTDIDDFKNMKPVQLTDFGNSGELYGKNIIFGHYEKTFLSLVTETEFGNDVVYLSEKTFKPIFCKHPFLMVASKYTLREIKKLGYKTFDKWWDESYDECDNVFDRINEILKILDSLKLKTPDELFQIRLEMQDVLNYNYELYIKRRNDIKIDKHFVTNIFDDIFKIN